MARASNRVLCDRDCGREAEIILYPADCNPWETEAGDCPDVCGPCVPAGAIRVSPFAFQEARVP